MATRGFFYDAVDGEPSYGSEAFAQWSKGILSEGYVPNVGDELEVTESSPAAMSVRVGLGIAWPDGRFFEVYDNAETLTIPNADGSNPRIDRVVVRNDLDNRETVLAVKTGSPASSPDPPSLTRTETVYEISLAQVLVGAGATSVTDSDITDERDDEGVCGAAVANAAPVSASGSYTGDGSSSGRTISVGLDPIYVFIRDQDSSNAWDLTNTANAFRHFATGNIHASSDFVYLTNEGFVVGDGSSTAAAANNNGNNYDWIALG